ncbi:protein A19 [BeAn 58058 virus]|uniref:protein A19 n=1 Tax=BeAn 58058 virus TaxID=67082 RepID=UPI000909FCE7|nr:protein A19 [BeAn 58058 virus]APG58329.1 protein A19 [BeAn 58058 virus]
MDNTAGQKRKKKRRTKNQINDTSTLSCSSCHSKLVNVSDVTKVSFDAYKVSGKGDILSCSECGSELRLLNGFVG